MEAPACIASDHIEPDIHLIDPGDGRKTSRQPGNVGCQKASWLGFATNDARDARLDVVQAYEDAAIWKMIGLPGIEPFAKD